MGASIQMAPPHRPIFNTDQRQTTGTQRARRLASRAPRTSIPLGLVFRQTRRTTTGLSLQTAGEPVRQRHAVYHLQPPASADSHDVGCHFDYLKLRNVKCKVFANGAATTVYFQWGTTTNYGSSSTPGSIETQNFTLNYPISGLSPYALPFPDRGIQQRRDDLRKRPDIHDPTMNFDRKVVMRLRTR